MRNELKKIKERTNSRGGDLVILEHVDMLDDKIYDAMKIIASKGSENKPASQPFHSGYTPRRTKWTPSQTLYSRSMEPPKGMESEDNSVRYQPTIIT